MMYFNLVSRRWYSKMSCVTGKGVDCRVSRWLLLMVMLAGQVGAQESGCVIPPPPCEVSFSPSTNLLLGQSFNVTYTIGSDECVPGCYEYRIIYRLSNGGVFGGIEFETVLPFITIFPAYRSGSCSLTLFIDGEATQLQNDYIRLINNAQWLGSIVLATDLLERTPVTARTTKVQDLLSGIPQQSIQANIQSLDIMMQAIALSSSEQIEDSYQAKVMLKWPHAESLDSDGTYFDREYLINGTTPEGYEGALARTTANSTELTLNSKQAAENLTLTTANRLGIGGTTSFQIPRPELSVSLNPQGNSNWLVVVEFSEPVKGLTVYDSEFMSVALGVVVQITDYYDGDPTNTVLTFTANLVDEQNYTIRLNFEDPAITDECINTNPHSEQCQKKPHQTGLSAYKIGLLTSAAMAAIVVSKLMQGCLLSKLMQRHVVSP